jgi:hypothetical protein
MFEFFRNLMEGTLTLMSTKIHSKSLGSFPECGFPAKDNGRLMAWMMMMMETMTATQPYQLVPQEILYFGHGVPFLPSATLKRLDCVCISYMSK